MGRKETPLEKIGNISQLFGIMLITISVLGGIFPNLRLIEADYLIGGVGVGAIFAFVIPFWINKVRIGRLW